MGLLHKTEKSPNKLFDLIEAIKWGYAHRSSLGDTDKIRQEVTGKLSDLHISSIHENFSVDKKTRILDSYDFKPDHGTMHISVLSESGDAVAFTSTVNHLFGSHMMDYETGKLQIDS